MKRFARFLKRFLMHKHPRRYNADWSRCGEVWVP